MLSCGLCGSALLADRWQAILGEFPGRCTQCNNMAMLLQFFLQPACLHRHLPCVERHGLRAVNCKVHILPFRRPDFAPWNGLPSFHPDKARTRLQVLRISRHGCMQVTVNRKYEPFLPCAKLRHLHPQGPLFCAPKRAPRTRCARCGRLVRLRPGWRRTVVPWNVAQKRL